MTVVSIGITFVSTFGLAPTLTTLVTGFSVTDVGSFGVNSPVLGFIV